MAVGIVSIGLALATLAWAVRLWHAGNRHTAADVRAELHRADGRVAEAFTAARRAMNEAAGQSWRNMTD